MAEKIPTIADVLSDVTDTRRVLSQVAMGLIFNNPGEVKTYTHRPGLQIEALALIGRPMRTSLRAYRGNVGSVQLGYHYAYLVDDAEHNESRLGLVFANPRIRNPHSGFILDPNQTSRNYLTNVDDKRYAQDVDYSSDELDIDTRVFRQDFDDSYLIAEAPLEETLTTPVAVPHPHDDDVTTTFKQDIIAIISSQAVRPLSNYLLLPIDL